MRLPIKRPRRNRTTLYRTWGIKILLVDHDGVGLAFALRCQKAGHAVRWFIAPKKSTHPDIGKGFKGIERIENWVMSAKWADLIWCSSNDDYLPKLDYFKRQGKAVFTPSVESAKLEIKRGEGMKFLEKMGIEVPEYQVFKNLKEAESHVLKSSERYVFKTLGDNEDKSLSYCADSPADMIARLRRWQETGMNPEGPVMLQKFIPGVEFAVSRWVGKNGFIGEYNENFERKKLLSGDFGPNCGESGTIQKYVKDSKLGEEVLAPLEEELVKMGHFGDVDVNCIVDESGKAWPLEFTMRCGWPAFNIMLAEHKGDPCEWMRDACEGKDTLEVSPQVACGVVVAQPDYPYSNKKPEEVAGLPIYGVSDENRKYLAPQCVQVKKLPDMDGDKVVEREIWATAGDYLMVVTGLGKTVERACERAYKTVAEIKVSDMLVRDDLGEKMEEAIPKLQKHGYASEFTYG